MEENPPLYSNISCDDDFGDFNDDDDNEIDRTEQIFNFVDVSLFVSPFSGSPNYKKLKVKIASETASENHSYPYSNFISAGEKFQKDFI